MIRYSLVCSAGHEFEQWFDNMADYDTKKEASALVCPTCGDVHVSKGIMAPRLSGSGGTVGTTPDAAPACGFEGGCGGGGCALAS